MYKLIFIDLDGTLLDSKQQISQYNCEVIKSLEAQAKIVLSSARGFYRMKKYVEQLDLLNSNNYTISYNGSLTIDNLENKIINESLEKNHLFELIKFIKMNDPHKWYFHCYDKKINFKDIENMNEFILANDIYKINCVLSEAHIEKLRKTIPDKMNSMFQITSSFPTHISFAKKGITKLEAIKKISSNLNIDKKDIIAIGDGENDIEMIQYACCGVAMENAMDSVKAAADLITDSNDKDGVGKVLVKLLNN